MRTRESKTDPEHRKFGKPVSLSGKRALTVIGRIPAPGFYSNPSSWYVIFHYVNMGS